MVRYSNYDPPEVDSLWLNEVKAQERADELNEKDSDSLEWVVTRWTVKE